MGRLRLLALGTWQVLRASMYLFAKAIWLTGHLVEFAIWLVLLIGPGVFVVLSGDYSNAGGWIFFYSGLVLILGVRFFWSRKASTNLPPPQNSS